MCDSPYCGEDTFQRAMADAFTAGQESLIQAVTEALKDVLESGNLDRLRDNLKYPEHFPQAVADLVALGTIDNVRLTKWDTARNRWKWGFRTGTERQRDIDVAIVEGYSRDPSNLLLRENLYHIFRIMDLLKKQSLKD